MSQDEENKFFDKEESFFDSNRKDERAQSVRQKRENKANLDYNMTKEDIQSPPPRAFDSNKREERVQLPPQHIRCSCIVLIIFIFYKVRRIMF